MIITLKNADFSASNIGTLSSWRISRSLGTGATYEGVTSVDKDAAFTATITLAENYEVGAAGVTITMGGAVLSGAHSISGNVITITIASVTGNVLIKVPTVNTATGEEEEPEEPDTPTSDTIAVTWEQGAIDSGKGPNSGAVMSNRLRTQGYIKVNSSITISASDNAEFCPIYYKADKTYISSPSAYQTDTLTVSGSTYPLVRIMVRDKSNTDATMSAAFGDNITITGDGTEIPYNSTNINGIHDGATWVIGALNSSTGQADNTYKTRIRTGYIPLGSVTVSVNGGNAEFCPVLYDDSHKFKSSPAVYQTTTQTFTPDDGAYLVLMARNSTATNTNLSADYGNNISIAIE